MKLNDILSGNCLMFVLVVLLLVYALYYLNTSEPVHAENEGFYNYQEEQAKAQAQAQDQVFKVCLLDALQRCLHRETMVTVEEPYI